ncbi:MAG: dephospho-CoA kinase [Butyrivibrio sp.]|nr:dephospho-CoA kinase [Acetatifactor muris]MCM1560598.1 dephospho-CoA kinase [Butyrivibrio sp.]
MKPNSPGDGTISLTRPIFIGITGGIGAGKSEILQYIGKHYNCEIYLADSIAHAVKEPGTDCFRKLVALLGEDITGPDGRIDRSRMAEKIFFDGKLLEQVNGILHPAVKSYLLERLEQARQQGRTELFFVEAALLIECGYGALVDEMWYIYADRETRQKRLRQSRGYSGERIDGIMASQLSEEQFRENCDFVIDNSGTLAESFAQIDRKLEAFTWRE